MAHHLVRAQSTYKDIIRIHSLYHTHTHTLLIHKECIMLASMLTHTFMPNFK